MAKKYIIILITIASLIPALIININAAEYQEEFMPQESNATIQISGEQIQSSVQKAVIGLNVLPFNQKFTKESQNYTVYHSIYYNKTIKNDVSEVFIYINISNYYMLYQNNSDVINLYAINKSADIRINNQDFKTDAYFNSQGILIYKIPVKQGDNIQRLQIRVILTAEKTVLANSVALVYDINESKLIYNQTEADRIIEKLKEQSLEEKEQVESQQNKVDNKLNSLESSANVIDGIEKPTITIDKNPVDISKTSIPSLISNITNHPYLVMLFALVSTLVIISALLFGV